MQTNMKKEIVYFISNHKYFVGFLIILTMLELLPVGTYTLLNAATYKPLMDFKLATPALNYILEPFIGIPVYLSTTHYIKPASISIFSWGLLMVLVYGIIKRRYKKLPVYVLAYIAGFSIFIVYILFTPFPLLKAIPRDKSFCLIDPHSHTFYSHDGLVTLKQSIRYHKKQGFTGWFITEHYNILGGIAEENITKLDTHKSMIGEEVRVDHDPHFFLALGISSTVTAKDITTVTALARSVHKQGGALVLALWWLRGPVNLIHYINDGVDAFEIANAGHKQHLTASIREYAYNISQKYHIPLIASSDWHGWGNYAYTWTAFKIPGAKDYTSYQLQNIIISMIRNRNNKDIIPIIYDYPHQYWGVMRFIFEPFFDFYYYFSTLPFKGYISWLIWSFLFMIIYSVYQLYRESYYYKPAIMPYVLFIAGSLMSLFYAVHKISSITFIPVENTLLLTVIRVLLFYSIGMLTIMTLLLALTIKKKGV